MQQRTLEELVMEFRRAIQSLVDEGFWFGICINDRFPRGACDDSSMLLAAYLTDNGFPGALRISGSKGSWAEDDFESHAWLQLNGRLIDITGSQFEGYNQPEILIAESDKFLETFTIDKEPRLADYREQQPQLANRSHFTDSYKAICERIATG